MFSFILGAFLLVAGTLAQPTTFCGLQQAIYKDDLLLSCSSSATISSINFVAYGTPSGSCAAQNLAHNATCDWTGAQGWAEAACIGKSSCILTADGHTAGVPDPCPGIIKALAVVATCSSGTGTASPVTQPCSMTQGFPPCPLPAWTPVWDLNRSTICQPGASVGESWLNATAAAKFGLVSLDWSVANGEWSKGGNVSAMTGAATLVEQCRRIKEVDPTTKCFAYRNTILALEWMEPHRSVMNDPAFVDLFLLNQPGNPGNLTPGTPYGEDAGGPGAGCRQFFWNYSNPDAVGYVLGVSNQGALATGSPYVDGIFHDDSQALPQEHPNAPANMGLTPLQLLEVQNATYNYFNLAIKTLASNGKFIWQGFSGMQNSDPDGMGLAPTPSTCASYMATVCTPSWQDVPYTVQWSGLAPGDKLPVLAAFLIGRGPYAYIGFAWTGGGSIHLPPWDPIWDEYDVGVPTGLCQEESQGVFSRQWSKGKASLDCNNWQATLAF